MSLSFDDLLDADLENTFLDTNYFGQSVTFYPPDCATKRTISVKVDHMGSYIENNSGKWNISTIDVTVRRSSTEGISESELGGAIVLSGDDPDQGYAWTGERTEVFSNCWKLRFQRKTPYKIGGTRQR